jgi:hypothetical protein
VTKLRILCAALLALLILGAAAAVARARHTDIPLLQAIGAQRVVRAPENVRVRVQVLNTTKTRGLARRATRLLRDRGFDVVEMGTSNPTFDSTLVLDRSGHPEWAALVAEILQPARAVPRPDSSRYLDVTVLIGSNWRPPAEPFHP